MLLLVCLVHVKIENLVEIGTMWWKSWKFMETCTARAIIRRKIGRWRQHDFSVRFTCKNHFKLIFLLNYLSKSWSDYTIKFVAIKFSKQDHTWIYSNEIFLAYYWIIFKYCTMFHQVYRNYFTKQIENFSLV